MDENSAVTETSLLEWYGALREGRSQATEKLWRLYFARMVHVAKRKLTGVHRAMHDEEDVALSAFKSFCMGFQQGRFQGKPEADNLWPLLVTLTINKSIDHLRRENRLKRGGRKSASNAEQGLKSEQLWNELVSLEPSPELQLATDEAFEALFAALDATGDLTLRIIALLTIEGCRTSEIAKHLGSFTVRTVQRKLKTIRAIWEDCNP